MGACTDPLVLPSWRPPLAPLVARTALLGRPYARRNLGHLWSLTRRTSVAVVGGRLGVQCTLPLPRLPMLGPQAGPRMMRKGDGHLRRQVSPDPGTERAPTLPV
jgi:hypothetical protein